MEAQGINWTLVIIAAVGALPGIFAAVFAYMARQQSVTNEGKISTLSENVDGKMDKLLEAREDAANARGQLKERDAERVHRSESTE